MLKSRMDPIVAASELRRLLVIHDTIVKQLQELDLNIETISRRIFANDLNISQDMSIYYLRLSTANGVKNMLEKCRCQLSQRVKKLSRQIISAIQADDMSGVQQTELQEEHSNPPATMDTAAIQYTRDMTMAFRSD